MASAEANGGSARVDVAPVVVVLGHSQVSSVFIAVGVAVANEGGLPVVVNIRVGNGDEIRSMGELLGVKSARFEG